MTHNALADIPSRGRRLPPGTTGCGRRGSRWWWPWPTPGDRSPPVPMTAPPAVTPIGRPQPVRLMPTWDGCDGDYFQAPKDSA